MKETIPAIFLIFGFFLFAPISSAKFQDCWGKWQTGYPGAGDCYAVNSVEPDNTPLSFSQSYVPTPVNSSPYRQVPPVCTQHYFYSRLRRRWIHYSVNCRRSYLPAHPAVNL